jgi:ribosome maturation factor RimP
MVELKTYKPLDGSKEFTGTLRSFDKDTVTIDTDGTERDFARADIAKINLYVEF